MDLTEYRTPGRTGLRVSPLTPSLRSAGPALLRGDTTIDGVTATASSVA